LEEPWLLTLLRERIGCSFNLGSALGFYGQEGENRYHSWTSSPSGGEYVFERNRKRVVVFFREHLFLKIDKEALIDHNTTDEGGKNKINC